ncbi:MAG: RIP metalloprotease RseP [Rikenellaceae bacterium]|nr:RIP metalloprotease RseP [Rikenellaceae bacterium]
MWIKIGQLILSLSLLVIVHELGHFLFAKLFKCRVEKFYLFFNPWFSLFKFKIGETTYGIGWIPFGGYVKISGMIDESMDTEQMKQPPKPYEFRSKPAWQRLLIMIGGVAMNVILAAAIYIGLSYKYGDSYISAENAKYGFQFSELAQEIGFRNGDKILSIEGKPVDNYNEVFFSIILDQVKSVEVERNGEKVPVNIDPDFLPRILKEKKTFMAPLVPFVIYNVADNSGAQLAGIINGDTILTINGQPAFLSDQTLKTIGENKGGQINMEIARDSAGYRQIINKTIPVSENGTIGVELTPFIALLDISKVEYNMISAIPAGFKRAGTEISNYLKQLKLMFKPKTEAYKSVGGFIAIGNIFPDTWSWYNFWNITALLSIMLAVMNLLPIPALDGGHVMFLLYEVITRRKPSDKFLEKAQMVGLVLLLALLLYANGNDVSKLISKWIS